MDEWVQRFIEAAISIFAIVNPIGNLPLLGALTEDSPPPERRRIFRLAGLTALCILVGMAIGGQFLLTSVFHVSIPEFTFGGGVLLAVISIRNILSRMGPPQKTGSPSGVVSVRTGEADEITLAISPIAFPLLVGPGSIVTVMLVVSRDGLGLGLAASLAAFVFILAILNWSHALLRLMGRIGSLAVGRVLQIFILAIGVHFMFKGARDAFPGLLK